MTGKFSFSPVQVGRAGEEIALQIEAAILNGSFKPGERLPSERELQNQFHTGRGVIREALGALKQKGLVEIKKGAKGGAFVKNVEMHLVSESLALFLKQQQIAPSFLIEARESIDRTITTLAITRGSNEEKDLLISNSNKLYLLAKSEDCNLAKIFEIDKELNLLFARMTRNPIFEWIMRAIQSGLGSYDHCLYINIKYRKKAAINWVNTAKSIKKMEPLQALSFIGHHYTMLRECINDDDNNTNIKINDEF